MRLLGNVAAPPLGAEAEVEGELGVDPDRVLDVAGERVVAGNLLDRRVVGDDAERVAALVAALDVAGAVVALEQFAAAVLGAELHVVRAAEELVLEVRQVGVEDEDVALLHEILRGGVEADTRDLVERRADALLMGLVITEREGRTAAAHAGLHEERRADDQVVLALPHVVVEVLVERGIERHELADLTVGPVNLAAVVDGHDPVRRIDLGVTLPVTFGSVTPSTQALPSGSVQLSTFGVTA